MRTHLAIFFADRGDVAVLNRSCDKIANPDGLALLAIRSNDRRKSRERAHLANACKFNRRYLTCPDIGDFICRSRRSAKIAIAAPGTPGDFRRSRRSAYKIAKCVAGLTDVFDHIIQWYRHILTWYLRGRDNQGSL